MKKNELLLNATTRRNLGDTKKPNTKDHRLPGSIHMQMQMQN